MSSIGTPQPDPVETPKVDLPEGSDAKKYPEPGLIQSATAEQASSVLTDKQEPPKEKADPVQATTDPRTDKPYSYEDVEEILMDPPDIIREHMRKLLEIGGSLDKHGSWDKAEELLTDEWLQILDKSKNDPNLVRMFTDATFVFRVSFPPYSSGRWATPRMEMVGRIIKTMKALQRYLSKQAS